MSRSSRPPKRRHRQLRGRALTGPDSPSQAVDPADDPAAFPRHWSRGHRKDSWPYLLLGYEKVSRSGDGSEFGALPSGKFVRRMAVDARTQKDGDSPLKSVSWSETTVAQVDDRCVQAPRREFISLMSGKGLRKYQKQKLVKFDGIDTKRLLDNSESEKYIPLCDIFNAVEELAKSKFRWKVVANHGESAEVDHKPDLARYPVDVPAAVLAYTRDMTKDDPNIARCAWAWMNSYVEVKNAEVKSPFFFAHNIDKDGRQKFLRHSDIGRKARGQFIKYATEAMLRQHRTHYYSFYLSEMSARVFRWDRVGCIASEPIDLRENPEDFLDILYRLATSPDHGGVDNTVQLANADEISVLESYQPGDNLALQEYHESMLDDQLSYPIYK
ncbi:uncharacterized protein PHACADRAFT_194195, partial [Phanerochaete carnosa HHB-10118-sp]